MKFSDKSDKIKKIKKAAGRGAAVVLAVCLVGAAAVAVICPKGKIAAGISVNGIEIGGKTAEEAKTVLMSAELSETEEFTVYNGQGEMTFSAADIAFGRDMEKTVDAAYRIGRGENPLKNICTLVRVRISGKDLGFVCKYDREKIGEIIYGFGVSVNGERRHYITEYDDESVTVGKGISGQSEDVSEALIDFELGAGRGLTEIFVRLKKDVPPEPTADSLYDEIYIEPRDAYYEVSDGDVRLIPEVIGRQIDRIEAGTKLERLKNGEKITLKLVWLKPEVTLDDLNEKLFNHILARYSTSYSTGDRGRKANVELAAGKINGVILAPGAEFSFNGTVGERTKAAGFKEAPVFENGETTEGIGGGVCQVSSTLYSAVLYADLQVTQRRNHSLTVSYVPKGQDATVSYGTIDFKFKNSEDYPIKISASASGGKLTVTIYGTAPEKEKTVKIINNTIETKNPEVEEIQDKSLDAGTKKVISKGKTGYTVETVRIVLENGTEVKNEVISRSTYRMTPTKVAIGAKVPEALPPLPATPAPGQNTDTPETEENLTESD